MGLQVKRERYGNLDDSGFALYVASIRLLLANTRNHWFNSLAIYHVRSTAQVDKAPWCLPALPTKKDTLSVPRRAINAYPVADLTLGDGERPCGHCKVRQPIQNSFQTSDRRTWQIEIQDCVPLPALVRDITSISGQSACPYTKSNTGWRRQSRLVLQLQ